MMKVLLRIIKIRGVSELSENCALAVLCIAKTLSGRLRFSIKQGSVRGLGRELISLVTSSIEVGLCNPAGALEQPSESSDELEELMLFCRVQLLNPSRAKVIAEIGAQILKILA